MFRFNTCRLKLEQIMWLLALLYEMSDDDWDHVTLCMGCVVCEWYALTLGR